MRHKGRELEIGREEEEMETERERESYHGRGSKQEERSERGGLDNVIPPSQETAQTISKNEGAQWSRSGNSAGTNHN